MADNSEKDLAYSAADKPASLENLAGLQPEDTGATSTETSQDEGSAALVDQAPVNSDQPAEPTAAGGDNAPADTATYQDAAPVADTDAPAATDPHQDQEKAGFGGAVGQADDLATLAAGDPPAADPSEGSGTPLGALEPAPAQSEAPAASDILSETATFGSGDSVNAKSPDETGAFVGSAEESDAPSASDTAVGGPDLGQTPSAEPTDDSQATSAPQASVDGPEAGLPSLGDSVDPFAPSAPSQPADAGQVDPAAAPSGDTSVSKPADQAAAPVAIHPSTGKPLADCEDLADNPTALALLAAYSAASQDQEEVDEDADFDSNFEMPAPRGWQSSLEGILHQMKKLERVVKDMLSKCRGGR